MDAKMTIELLTDLKGNVINPYGTAYLGMNGEEVQILGYAFSQTGQVTGVTFYRKDEIHVLPSCLICVEKPTEEEQRKSLLASIVAIKLLDLH